MSGSTSNPTELSPLERELHRFIVTELVAGQDAESIPADEDLIRRGIVDSLGVTQLVEFCESQYGIRVAETELVPENFRSLRGLAEYVERKLSSGRR